ncbi:putative lipoprotein [Flavobacterium branchiophilum]|uniref:Probable lipoprotein n=1 Tax=Flavobacterium branchiophilum (strain FL-15) TaxID=1034807 RepID=G2Z4E0_FLABF|nr:DUF5025 domain-containing protein [Flavobacterium branchiophilum]CCB68415.1 Probable lipoprotein precursor [Flavobacterium branchiophilum FL-15]
MKKQILTLVATLLLFSCSKDSAPETPADTLPPATTTGANTAGCYINGKLLIPKNGSPSFSGTPYGLKYYYGGNFWPNKNDYWQLQISNNKDSNNNFGVVLWIKNMSTGNGDYLVGQSNGELYSLGPNNNQIFAGITENGVNKTYWSGQNAGIIKITRSDLGVGISIYSGTFNCTLYNKDNPTEIIQITDGRFDFNSLTLNH